MSEAITYQAHGDTAVIVLDDGKANAFGHAFIACFNAQLDRAEKEAKAVAILGRPGLLSGGFDLKVINGGDPKEINRMVNAGARLMMRIYGHPQPVVVGATGHAVALGAFLLLAADYRIGTEGEFKIGLNETAIGLSLPEFGIALATDRLSRRHLSQATIGATLYDPTHACDIGYLDTVSTPSAIRDTVISRANEMAKLDGPAFAASKATLRGETIRKVVAGLG
ncbi:MAG: crotonase/enoyl-CoA hydratase family protein [Proteobacteria bacterium]|nr:crotonase/enoyl-CoA hydratase family protein [Pseudomonadota bacterium]